ncbi:hypothetical protein FIU87_08000 [Bacillus sp. THAF10]|nr:hypothetical protein FIU87_08000 [Bacillus sp. THAF10]
MSNTPILFMIHPSSTIQKLAQGVVIMNKHFSFQPEQSVSSSFKSLEMTKEEKVAQIIVDSSVYQFHKNRLMNEIDEALSSGNRKQFKLLSRQYIKLNNDFSHLQ